MNPKSEKPLRLFSPFSIWTDIALKSGTAMLEAAQAAVTSAKSPNVAVLPEADAPSLKPPRGQPRSGVRALRAQKKRIISRPASGTLGSVYDPAALPPHQAWPAPCTSQCSRTVRPVASLCTLRVYGPGRTPTAARRQ